MKKVYSLALATGAVILLAGCDPAVKADAGEKKASREIAAAKPPSAAENDGRIESSFKKSYVYTTYLKNEKIAISSKNGAVTLTGAVGDANQKPMAEHTASALPGVKSVENHIQVMGETVPENSDAWIRSRVKAELLFHRNVSAGKTEVEVLDGNVTLRGEASSQAQKELTTEFAKDVESVKEVNNEMTVAEVPASPAPPTASTTESTVQAVTELIDDASITAQIRMSLLFHRSTSALKTKVETKDGVVTLGGEAKNAAEKDLVSKLVADINGVKSVSNNMTVQTIGSKSD